MLDYVSELWGAGLVAQGLAVFDSAPDADRQLLLSDKPLPEVIGWTALP